MTKLSTKIKHFIRNNKWWSGLIAFVFVFIFYTIFLKGDKNIIPDSVVVEKRTIIEEVSTTGNVKPLSNIDLSFEMAGRVSVVAVSVGDTVHKGQYLASVSNADLVAGVDQAKAGLEIAQANLELLEKGTRPEELTLSKSTLDDAEQTLLDKMNEAYVKSDDAIRNNIDQMFNNPRDSSAQLTVSFNNAQLENQINSARYSIELMLNSWGSNSDISLSEIQTNLNLIKDFLDMIASGINYVSASSNITQTTIDKYKTAVSSSRTSINLAISNLTSAQASYNSAKSSYELKLAGSTPESINAQRATVSQAQANINSANAQLEKSIIRSPINGVITKVNAKIGETTQTGIPAISVISYGSYEIESLVAEADIVKVKIGDIATTTLDAYGSSEFFLTEVIKIDPAETIVDNVPTYKITLKFIEDDNRIKSGMTANLDILTNKKIDVLAIPSRSVYSVNGLRFVKIIDEDDPTNIREVAVTVGIRGIDGFIEIISGVNEGDKVVASPNR
jgi:HlyD family secretion protein